MDNFPTLCDVDEVFRISCGIPRMVNRIGEKSLTSAAQQQKRLIDDHIG